MSDRHPRRWWILGVLCTSLLVLNVDNMILTLAVPALMRDLGASPASIQWILDAYILVYAGLLLTAGSLSDRYGRRRFLMIGLAILGVGSLLAAFASEPWQVIACRAVMGAGAATAMPSTLSIAINIFDETERRKAMAVWGVVGMVGIVAGPALGGLLLQHFWWGSAFLVNVPIAVVAIVALLLLAPESHGEARPSDPVGVLLSITGMAAFVWALISLPHEGWTAGVVGALSAGVVILAAFGWWESRTPHPMIPLRLFRDRDFTGASLAVVLVVFTNGAVLLALTQFLQQVLGFEAMTAAFAFAPLAVMVAIVNVLGATLAKSIGNKTLIVAGLLLIAAGFGVLALIGPGDGYPFAAVGLVVIGAGTGLSNPAVYATIMGAIPGEQAGAGSAVVDTIQQGGTALGVAALGSVLSAAYTAGLPADVAGPATTSLSAALEQAARTGSTGLARVARDAFVSSMSVVFTIACLLAVAGAVCASLVLKPKIPVQKGKVHA